MKLETISIEKFRNYEKASIFFNQGINLIIGENGQGKTNFLESIYYLLTNHPLRLVKEKDLISWYGLPMRLFTSFHLDESTRKNNLKFATDGKEKYLSLNDVKYEKRSELPFLPYCVAFIPDDLQIIKGSPDKRRNYLDKELSILYPTYNIYRKKYQRTLHQRNEILKTIKYKKGEKNLLLPWNEQLAIYGAKLITMRLEFLKVLVPIARKIHKYLIDKDNFFNISYQSSFGALKVFSEEEIKTFYMSFFEKYESEEIQKGTTLFGPHRDDLIFYENKVDLRYYGSQGQQRTAILSLKLALVSFMERVFKEKPILLLDDVMSELDLIRQNKLLNIIEQKDIQTFVTGVSDEFHSSTLLSLKRYYVKEGQISPFG